MTIPLKPHKDLKAEPVEIRLPASVHSKIEANVSQIKLDQELNSKILMNQTQRVWMPKWGLPLKAAVTSRYGRRRYIPGKGPYAHTGVDLRAAVGTPIRAVSDGVVVMAQFQVLSGNTIVIDHGFGIMSRYMHLSEYKVKLNDEVNYRQVIGLSGATGRVEAPHLHWEMRIRGRPVDPLSTVRLMERLVASE